MLPTEIGCLHCPLVIDEGDNSKNVTLMKQHVKKSHPTKDQFK